MATNVPTFIGYVASVMGGSVRVRLKSDLQTSLVMIEGESYRVGQIGAFLRIPLGYSQLFGICTLVGADAAPLIALNLQGIGNWKMTLTRRSKAFAG